MLLVQNNMKKNYFLVIYKKKSYSIHHPGKSEFLFSFFCLSFNHLSVDLWQKANFRKLTVRKNETIETYSYLDGECKYNIFI